MSVERNVQSAGSSVSNVSCHQMESGNKRDQTCHQDQALTLVKTYEPTNTHGYRAIKEKVQQGHALSIEPRNLAANGRKCSDSSNN